MWGHRIVYLTTTLHSLTCYSRTIATSDKKYVSAGKAYYQSSLITKKIERKMQQLYKILDLTGDYFRVARKLLNVMLDLTVTVLKLRNAFFGFRYCFPCALPFVPVL